jgi:hypothetical protein
MVGDRYDFVTIHSVKDVLDQPGLVHKIMDQLLQAFHAILPRKEVSSCEATSSSSHAP